MLRNLMLLWCTSKDQVTCLVFLGMVPIGEAPLNSQISVGLLRTAEETAAQPGRHPSGALSLFLPVAPGCLYHFFGRSLLSISNLSSLLLLCEGKLHFSPTLPHTQRCVPTLFSLRPTPLPFWVEKPVSDDCFLRFVCPLSFIHSSLKQGVQDADGQPCNCNRLPPFSLCHHSLNAPVSWRCLEIQASAYLVHTSQSPSWTGLARYTSSSLCAFGSLPRANQSRTASRSVSPSALLRPCSVPGLV